MSRLALVVPTLRAIRRGPVVSALVMGLAIVAVPAVMTVALTADNLAALLRLGMASAAVGVAFLFDDPAKPTTATAPAPAWHSVAIRAAAALTAMAAWWAAAVTITLAGAKDDSGDRLPLRGLTVEAAALGAIALAAAVVAWRLTPRGHASPVAAPVSLVAVAALAFAPSRMTVFVSVVSPEWDAAHQRLAVLLAACLLTAAAAVLLPARRLPAIRIPGPAAARTSPSTTSRDR